MNTTHPFYSVATSLRRFFRRQNLLSFAAILALFGQTACETTSLEAPTSTAAPTHEAAPLIEGDMLSISFPGATDLNTEQKVRRDGRITLPLVGEIVVAGLTPAQLEAKLLDLYNEQLVTKEVTVSVTASSYSFYVNGAVLSPGKKISDRPLTALEAIMEAGGPTATANIRKVAITRQINGEYVNYELDLQDILDGKKKSVFYIKPSDILTVPEKFALF